MNQLQTTLNDQYIYVTKAPEGELLAEENPKK